MVQLALSYGYILIYLLGRNGMILDGADNSKGESSVCSIDVLL
jgi:hypothetical protein